MNSNNFNSGVRLSLTPRFSAVLASAANVATVLTVSACPGKTVETVSVFPAPFNTQLKQGVNENSTTPTANDQQSL
jgi:hypothetical protein